VYESKKGRETKNPRGRKEPEEEKREKGGKGNQKRGRMSGQKNKILLPISHLTTSQ